MKRRPVVDRRYWPDGEKNAFSSPSKSDRCVCIPDPGCSMNGLGMKVATSSSRSATSSMTVRAVMMLSAARTGSTARRSISFWPGPPSWCENSTGIPMSSSMRTARRRKSLESPRAT